MKSLIRTSFVLSISAILFSSAYAREKYQEKYETVKLKFLTDVPLKETIARNEIYYMNGRKLLSKKCELYIFSTNNETLLKNSVYDMIVVQSQSNYKYPAHGPVAATFEETNLDLTEKNNKFRIKADCSDTTHLLSKLPNVDQVYREAVAKKVFEINDNKTTISNLPSLGGWQHIAPRYSPYCSYFKSSAKYTTGDEIYVKKNTLSEVEFSCVGNFLNDYRKNQNIEIVSTDFSAIGSMPNDFSCYVVNPTYIVCKGTIDGKDAKVGTYPIRILLRNTDKDFSRSLDKYYQFNVIVFE